MTRPNFAIETQRADLRRRMEEQRAEIARLEREVARRQSGFRRITNLITPTGQLRVEQAQEKLERAKKKLKALQQQEYALNRTESMSTFPEAIEQAQTMIHERLSFLPQDDAGAV